MVNLSKQDAEIKIQYRKLKVISKHQYLDENLKGKLNSLYFVARKDS